MVHFISILRGDCTTKDGSLCAFFFNMGNRVKTHVKNGLDKLLDFRGQNNDVSIQAVLS